MKITALLVSVLLPSLAWGANLALNMPAFQSDTRHGGDASLAVDGNSNPDYFEGSCTHTNGKGNEWWAVDLGGPKQIYFVRITNRADCCSDRLRNFYVGLTNIDPREQAPAPGNYEVCTRYALKIAAGETRVVRCLGTGRYLIIQLIPKEVLTLCEVEVYGDPNLALYKPAFQSSTSAGGDASRAVDGNSNPSFPAGSCSLTNNRHGEWWAVDFKAIRTINLVRITNRGDCCLSAPFLVVLDHFWNRLRTLFIVAHPNTVTDKLLSVTVHNHVSADRLYHFLVGTTNRAPIVNHLNPAYQACIYRRGRIAAGGKEVFRCTRTGRFLIFQLMYHELKPLTLCEVEVYGGTNIALGKWTTQSSTSAGGLASRAVDGNTNPNYPGGSCSHTKGTSGYQWWAVSLGDYAVISSVRITNRKDCCADRLGNFNVGLTNIPPFIVTPKPRNYEVCAKVDQPLRAGDSKFLICPGSARYLVIQRIPAGVLTLCEVEVYGVQYSA